MSPQSASRGPVERGFVVISPARRCGGLGRENSDFCLIFGIPSWLLPLRDRSGQRWPPSGLPYVVAATEVCSRFIGTCWSLSISGDPFLLPAMNPSCWSCSGPGHTDEGPGHSTSGDSSRTWPVDPYHLAPSYSTRRISRYKFEDLILQFAKRLRPFIPVCTTFKSYLPRLA